MILVTGATGNVGREVVRALARRGVPFRVGARAPERISEYEAVPFDFLDAATYPGAVEGCDAVFLLRPPAVADTRKTLNVFLDVARARGAGQVVFVSVAGAGDNPLVPHHAVEQHLRAHEGGWTILRPGFFAQNIGDAYREDIVQDDRIYVPAGSGNVAFVDVRDVAEVAAMALTDPAAHRGQTYTLSGPEAITFDEVAEILTQKLGRRIRYEPANILGYAFHLYKRRMPLGQILVQTILHVGLRFGQAEAVSPTLARVLGHAPHTVRGYVHDHRDTWL